MKNDNILARLFYKALKAKKRVFDLFLNETVEELVAAMVEAVTV